jgi:hypothetical protein
MAAVDLSGDALYHVGFHPRADAYATSARRSQTAAPNNFFAVQLSVQTAPQSLHVGSSETPNGPGARTTPHIWAGVAVVDIVGVLPDRPASFPYGAAIAYNKCDTKNHMTRTDTGTPNSQAIP